MRDNFLPIPECDGMRSRWSKTDFQDVTSLDSPNGFREYIKL